MLAVAALLLVVVVVPGPGLPVTSGSAAGNSGDAQTPSGSEMCHPVLFQAFNLPCYSVCIKFILKEDHCLNF